MVIPFRASAAALVLLALACAPGQARAQPFASDSAALLTGVASHALERGTPASLEESIRLYRRALPHLRASGHRIAEGEALRHVARAHRELGRADSALAYHASGLAIARETGDRRGEGAALAGIGGAHLDLGRADSALAYSARALALQRAAGDRRGEAASLADRGAAHRALGRADSARASFRASLHAWRELGNPRGEAAALNHLALVFRDLGRADSASSYHLEALAVTRASGDRRGEGATLNHLAALEARGADPGGLRRAAGFWGEAGEAFLSVELRGRAAAAWDSAGHAYGRAGARDSALAWTGRSLELRDTARTASIDALLASTPLLRPTRTVADEERFVTGVRRLLAEIRGHPTPDDEIPDAEAAHLALEALNAQRDTWIDVQTALPFEFGIRRWIHRNSDSPETWETRTASTRFRARRQGYQFRYVHPETRRVETLDVVCADSPCVVRLPRAVSAP